MDHRSLFSLEKKSERRKKQRKKQTNKQTNKQKTKRIERTFFRLERKNKKERKKKSLKSAGICPSKFLSVKTTNFKFLGLNFGGNFPPYGGKLPPKFFITKKTRWP